MTASFDDIRGEVVSGTHLILRVPGIAAVIRRDPGTGEAAAQELLELIRDVARTAAPTPGRQLAHRLTRWVVAAGAAPGFGTVAATEDGIAVFLHGDVSLSELPDGRQDERIVLSGRTAAFTVDRLLPWPQGPIALTAGPLPDAEPDTASAVPGWSGLVQGLVPGEGIVLGTRETAPPTSAGRHQAPDSARAGSAADRTAGSAMPASISAAQGAAAPPRPAGAPGAAAPGESVADGSEATQWSLEAQPNRRPGRPRPSREPAAGPTPPYAQAGGHPGPPHAAPGSLQGPPGPPAHAPAAPTPPPFPATPGTPPAPAVSPRSPAPSQPEPPAVRSTPLSPAAGAAPPPPPAPPLPGAAAAPLRPPRLSEQIFGSDQHEARRAPLPIAEPGGRAPAPAPAGPNQAAHVIVKGFRCSRGHLNDPRVSFCSVCGIRMDQATGVLVDGRRPPLGLLVLDIGATFVLDDNYLLGRNPEVDQEVISGRLRPIRLDDDSGTLSRMHAEIRLDGWEVLLIDRGSANGTYLAPPGQGGWTRLAPRHPVALTPGTHVRIGRRIFTFESSRARL